MALMARRRLSRGRSSRTRRSLGRGGGRSRRRRRRRSTMTSVAAVRLGVTYRVVHGTPVGGLDVLPGLVVSEGRRVAQRSCRAGRVGRVGLGGRDERKAHEDGQRHPGGFLFHFRSNLNRRRWSADARADARAPSGLARRPQWVRWFGEDALGRPEQSSKAERRGGGKRSRRAEARQAWPVRSPCR